MNISNHPNGDEYQSIFENATEGIFQSSIDGRYLKVNPTMARIYGYSSPEDMINSVNNIGKQIYVDAKERKIFLKLLQDNGHIDKFENQNYRKDGSVFWAQTNARIVRDKKGNPLLIEGFLTDITSRKETEIALHQSEDRFRTIFNANPIAMSITTVKEGMFIDANQAYWNLSEFDPDEVIGHTGVELGFTKTAFRQKLITKLKKEKSYHDVEGKFITKSGAVLNTLEFYEVIQMNGKDHILAMYYDITDQVKAQMVLQENEEKYRQLFEAESDAIFLIENEGGKILDVNAAASAMYGYSKAELLQMKNSDLSAEPEETRNVTRKTEINPEQIISIPLRYHKKKNGTIFPVEITGRFFNWRGCPVHIAAIRDITNRKKAEDALRASEERFRLAFLTSPDSININRLEDGLYVDINDGFTAITGYTREDAIGKTSAQINIWKNLDDRAKLVDGLRKIGVVDNLEAKFRIKNGGVVTGLMSARIIMLDDVPHIISITREIETLKQTEETLQRQLDELSILHNVAVTASSSKSIDELIQRATDIIYNTLHPVNCGVELVTDRGDMYQTHPSYSGVSKNEIQMPIPFSKGVTGKVITTGIPIRLGDVTQESAYIEVTKGVRSELCVPIKIHERVIGTINIESDKPDAFSDADERLLSTIAGTMATAIEQLRLFETSQRRLQELTILNAVSLASTEAVNVDELIEKVTQIIGESLYPDNFGVLLLSEGENAIYPHPSYRGIKDGKFPKRVPLGQGVSGQVAASRNPLRIANVRNHQKYIEVTSQVRSELCVPIAHGDRIHGVINAESLSINAFTEEDEQLLKTIASTLATAIEKLRLIESEKKRRQDAETLREATVAMTTSLEIMPLLESVLDNLFKILPYDSASIAVEHNGEMEIIAGNGFPKDFDAIGKYLPTDGMWRKPAADRQPMIVADVHEDPSFIQWDGSEYIRSWMGVPLISQDVVIGLLNIDSRKANAFSDRDALMAQTFANQAAIAIENARLFAKEQSQKQRNAILLDLMSVAASSLTLENVMQATLERVKELVPFTSGTIQMLEGNNLRIAASMGLASKALPLGKLISLKDFPLNKKTIKEKAPVYIPETEEYKDFIKIDQLEVVRSFLLIPLIYKNKAIGLISLVSENKAQFTEQDIDLILAIARHAAIVIENARLYKTEQRRHRESETLRQTAEAITSSLDIRQVLNAILINLSTVIPYDSAALFLIEGDKVRITAGKGFPDNDRVVGSLFPANNALLQEVWKIGKPIILEDAQSDPRFEKWAAADHVRGWMGIPLVARGMMIGCITIDSLKPGAFHVTDSNLAMTFAHQAAAAIENARLFERSEQQIRQLTVLRDIDSAISSSFDLRVTLDFIANHAIKELKVDAAAILLYNPDLEALYMHTQTGFSNKQLPDSTYIRMGEGLGGQVALNRKLVQIPDLSSSPEQKTAILVEKGFKSYFGIPLIGKGLVKGVLEIFSRTEINPTSDWLNFLHTLAGQAAIAIDNVELFKNLHRSNLELTLAYDTTLAGWGRALELRDKETQGHTNRVVKLTVELARRMGVAGENLTRIMRGTLLHDIGKMGIPDGILNKPGPLTEEEWGIMRQHPQYAYDLIQPIPYLRASMEIPYGHHERWDGSGYPLGLKGEEIPLAARIFAVVDIYDALLNKRVYREAWPEEKVIAYLKNAAGIEIDPAIVEKFLELIQEEHYKNQAE